MLLLLLLYQPRVRKLYSGMVCKKLPLLHIGKLLKDRAVYV